jgi:hypothetical protein
MAVQTKSLGTYSDLELALMVLLGYYGNGADRKKRLGSRYGTVQAIVEQILRGTVPSGTGPDVMQARISKAVSKVFQESNAQIAKEITNEF